MSPESFSELYEEAACHEDYWIAGAIHGFTESVVREMQRQGLTRTELAERLDATPAYVTKILRGKVNFTLATMVRLARALGSELDVRLRGGSHRRAAKSDLSTAQSGRSRRVSATAGRPAALRSKPGDRKSPRRPPHDAPPRP